MKRIELELSDNAFGLAEFLAEKFGYGSTGAYLQAALNRVIRWDFDETSDDDPDEPGEWDGDEDLRAPFGAAKGE